MLRVLFNCIAFFICSAGLYGQVKTPLQDSGLPALWQENFSNACMDRFQFAYAKGRDTTMDSFIIPGALYIGQKEVSSTPDRYVEMEINNFRKSGDELIAHTLEFDVLPVQNSNIRVSLRPWRRGDMMNLKIGKENDGTNVAFLFKGGPVLDYKVKTGPSYGWAHVAASYRSFRSAGGVYCQMVVAVNEEIHTCSGYSRLNDNLSTLTTWEEAWDKKSVRLYTDAWDIELQASSGKKGGRYLVNVRGYHEFLDENEMAARLTGKVQPYLDSLPDPRDYSGPKKYFRQAGNLSLFGPNVICYTEPVDRLKVRFDGSLSSSYHEISSFIWDFGDGAKSDKKTVEHAYAAPGNYAAALTITVRGKAKTRIVSVTASEPGYRSKPDMDVAILITAMFPWIFFFTVGGERNRPG